MASGKRGGEYINMMGWDKTEIDCDVGLGLKMQFQQHQHQQQQQQRGLVRKMISDEQISPYGDGGRSPVPFTADQRQELERQTIIYKYMMASMPVPPQLLIPLSKHPVVVATTTSNSGGGGRGGGGAGGDPEPWRCRRTDGKKWRCSRDVAPDQKYCERHSHKGRPSSRSRKPVESLLSPPTPPPPPPPPPSNNGASNPIDFSSPLVQYNLLPNPSYRYPERLMKKDVFTASPFRPQNHLVGQGLDTTTATTATTATTTAFIDAWSLADASNPTSVGTPTTASSSPSHSALPLTLSVSSGTGIDDHHRDIALLNDHHDHEDQAVGMRSMTTSSSSQPLNWMTSWISSPPGGPLAEALCLGISGSGAGSRSYEMRNNFDDLVSSSLPYGRNSSTNTGSKDTGDQIFRLH